MTKHALLLLVALGGLSACAGPQPRSDGSGIEVGDASAVRGLVPAAELEKSAADQYGQLKKAAAEKNALAPDNHPQLVRLRAIAKRILPHAERFNPEARNWKWEVNLIGSKQINAFCMPGGKIAFYTGILDTLQLTDDEVAVVMGHEIAHALREHARARIAKAQLTNIGAAVLGAVIGGGELFRQGGNLLTLKFSRNDESEADLIGLDLAARAGYDPRAGISLWKKMATASNGNGLAWLSTHPAGDDRIADIERSLPAVMPLYEAARGTRPGAPLKAE
jgi:predicted Zn-dependent protease